MVKIVFLADSHLGFDYPLRPKKEKRRRGIDFFNNFDQVLAYAKSNNADMVIHGGDLFFRTRVPAPIVDSVYERIFNFAESGIPIIIVPGNHESSRLPISLFMQHPNIFYFTGPQVFHFNIKEIDFDIAGFPCIRRDAASNFTEMATEIQAQLRSESIKLLCMHQTIEGAKVGPSDFTFRNRSDTIPINVLPVDYHLILSGHIHRTQILWTNNRTPVIYPGSIERTAFAEKEEEKGFYEIEFEDDQNYSYQFLKLNARPMVDVLLTSEEYTESSLQKEIRHKILDLPVDSILRFKLTNNDNLPLLNVKLLDSIIPPTMNYQVAGFRNELQNRKR